MVGFIKKKSTTQIPFEKFKKSFLSAATCDNYKFQDS